jgi:hypothetical protein
MGDSLCTLTKRTGQKGFLWPVEISFFHINNLDRTMGAPDVRCPQGLLSRLPFRELFGAKTAKSPEGPSAKLPEHAKPGRTTCSEAQEG